MRKLYTEYPILTVSKDAQFFAGICRIKKHNYVMAGYFEADEHGDQIPHLLLAIGKMGIACRKGGIYAEVGNEGLIKKQGDYFQNNKRNIHYKAYAISYDQYVSLVDHLKVIRAKNTKFRPHYYDQVRETEDTRTFVYSRGQLFKKEDVVVEKIHHNHNQLNIVTNDCRTSAKAILETVNIVDTAVSRHWYGKLPHKLTPVKDDKNPELIIHRHATEEDMQFILDYVDTLFSEKLKALEAANKKHATFVKQHKIEAITELKNELDDSENKLDAVRSFREGAKHFRSDHWYLEFGFISGLTRGMRFPSSPHKTRKLFKSTTSILLDEVEDVLSGSYRVVGLSV